MTDLFTFLRKQTTPALVLLNQQTHEAWAREQDDEDRGVRLYIEKSAITEILAERRKLAKESFIAETERSIERGGDVVLWTATGIILLTATITWSLL